LQDLSTILSLRPVLLVMMQKEESNYLSKTAKPLLVPTQTTPRAGTMFVKK
jgi:hypothetical protein